jgi:hypothetical protein
MKLPARKTSPPTAVITPLTVPTIQGASRPVSQPSSDRASAKPMEMHAPNRGRDTDEKSLPIGMGREGGGIILRHIFKSLGGVRIAVPHVIGDGVLDPLIFVFRRDGERQNLLFSKVCKCFEGQGNSASCQNRFELF